MLRPLPLPALLLACSNAYAPLVGLGQPTPFGEPAEGEAEEAPAVELPAVRLNELQPANDSTYMTEDGGFPDWVELYNAAAVAVPRAALSLDDGSGARWEGGEGALAPGERLLLFADDAGGEDSLPFSLDAEGETLTLRFGDGVVDVATTDGLHRDAAWARFPDGGDWAATATPTPGEANGEAPSATADPSELLFDPLRVHPLALTVSPEQWALLEADNYTYVEASLEFEAGAFTRVGLRKKSTVGSNRSLSQKAAFKVDLNLFEDHQLRGAETLTLNNMVQDPTYVAEHLAYTMFRASGVPAPRLTYARLSINGVDWGLYALVENIDDAFLDRWYADGSGHLYEGAYGVDVQADEVPSFECDECPEPEDRADLYALAAALTAPADDAGLAAVEALIDMDELLANMAVETLILHWDGYTTANNYRLYHDPSTGRFQILPWGTDQTFISASYGPYQTYGLLLLYCLQNAGCKARYEAALREAADTMDGLALQATSDALRAALAADIATDPRAEHSAETQQAYLDATRLTLETWPAAVRAAIPAPP